MSRPFKEYHQLGPFRFQHCATVAPYEDGVLIAFYGGSGECVLDQRVVIYYFDGEKYRGFKSLESLTGNPVLFRSGDNTYILYSLFEDVEHDNKVSWWKTCSNHIKRVHYNNGIIKLEDPNVTIDIPFGLLGRCAPLNTEYGYSIMPLYNEEDKNGEIFEFNSKYKYCSFLGKIGDPGQGLIQPTLWIRDDKFRSLSRNMVGNVAWYSESDDLYSWSDPVEVDIWNSNNSLVVTNEENPMIIWNDTPKGRSNLSIGYLNDNLTIASKHKIANYGSYPNYCVDDNGDLHIVFTEYQNGAYTIAHAIVNPAL